MSAAWNAWKNLSRGSRLAIGTSWLTIGAVGTLYQDDIESNVLRMMGKDVTSEKLAAASAPVIDGGDCDCKPLWDCMQRGGDCSLLRAELDACMAAKKATGKA